MSVWLQANISQKHLNAFLTVYENMYSDAPEGFFKTVESELVKGRVDLGWPRLKAVCFRLGIRPTCLEVNAFVRASQDALSD